MNPDVLLVITSRDSGKIVMPLLHALKRKSVSTAVFITGNGAQILNDSDAVKTLKQWPEVVVCSESWQQSGGGETCPVTLGSQTDHSRLMGIASRVVSL